MPAVARNLPTEAVFHRGILAGEGTVAASSVPTVQPTGFALGAALAGLAANASGFSGRVVDDSMKQVAFWVPASFVVAAAIACLAGVHLRHLRKP